MPDVHEQMRKEWDSRALEDAHYYVAFGSRGQDHAAFFATADEILTTFYRELKRGTPAPRASRRILEIGCGPGRLMRPLSEVCGEIHGVDVSEEMIVRARKNLAGIPHAHAHIGSGSKIDFPDHHFDFVYSYAVFQHIPSRDVVFSYLRETVRVLKTGGLARLQINGLPPSDEPYTTWEGVRIPAEDIREFAREHGIQLLALEGAGTQYMWTTFRRAAARAPATSVRIRRITNTFSSEPVAPVAGGFASISVWVEGLDDFADLNNLELTVAGLPATLTYLGANEPDGIRQLNAALPAGLRTGIARVELAGAAHRLRLIPKPPTIPRVMSLSDGVDLLSGPRIVSRTIKLSVEEFEPISDFQAEIGGRTATDVKVFCVDPAPPRHEVNISVPRAVSSGSHALIVRLGPRCVSTHPITIL